jgi:hypothetical protein
MSFTLVTFYGLIHEGWVMLSTTHPILKLLTMHICAIFTTIVNAEPPLLLLHVDKWPENVRQE